MDNDEKYWMGNYEKYWMGNDEKYGMGIMMSTVYILYFPIVSLDN